MGKLIEYMIEHIRLQSSKYSNPQGGLSIQGWGLLNITFKDFCRTIRMLDKNLIFVAHEITEKRGDNIRMIPDVRANNYSLLATELDLIGYIECIGSYHTISFSPTSEHDGKNTGGFEHQIKIPLLRTGMLNNFFEKNIISKHFDNVDKKTQKQSEIISKFREIDIMLESITSANGANVFTEEITKMDHIGTSLEYAKTKFKEIVKKLDLLYDKETKLYKERE